MNLRSLLPCAALALAALPACGEKNAPSTTTTAAAPPAPTPPPVTTTATATASATAPAAPKPRVWSFDKDKNDDPPPGFDLYVASGKAGKWLVKAESPAASGPNVLAQVDDDKKPERVAFAIAREPKLRDARVSVRCRTSAGKVEQSCGVALRFQDEKNYYAARVDALGKDVALFVVKDGKRRKLGEWKGATIGTVWHQLQVEAKEERFEVSWDGTRVFEAADTTHVGEGRIGVWSGADSVTFFDDLTVTPLATGEAP